MPHRKKGGTNNTRIKRVAHELKYPDSDNGQIVGTIDKLYGNCIFDVKLFKNGEIKKASLKGVIKKRVKIRINDLVLIEPLNEDVNKKYQIIFKYSLDQHKRLLKEGFLNTVETVEEKNNEPEDSFMFENEIKSYQEVVDLEDTGFIDDI